MLIKCRKQPGNCQNMLESVLIVTVKELKVFSVIWRMDSKGLCQLNFAVVTGYFSNEASMRCKLTNLCETPHQ